MGTGTEKGVEWGKTVGKVIGPHVVVRQSIPSPHIFNYNRLCISIQLQMKTGKQQHQQPVASTSKTTIATTSKTTSLDTKPTSKDPPKPKPAEKPKPTGKLDWSNAKTKDMKAAEAKEVKKKEEVRKEREGEARKEDAKKEKEKKQAEKEKGVKGKAKERPKNEDKVGLSVQTHHLFDRSADRYR